MSYADLFSPHEVVPASDIDSPLALIPVHAASINRDLWISVSFDHVCIGFYIAVRYVIDRRSQAGTEPDELDED